MAKNVRDTPIICLSCGISVKPTGNRQQRCPTCSRKRENNISLIRQAFTKKLKGYNQKGPHNNAWKGGTGRYKILLKEIFQCEYCGYDKHLCVHHIDHNRKNNERSNLKVTCRKCHWKFHLTKDIDGRWHSLKV